MSADVNTDAPPVPAIQRPEDNPTDANGVDKKGARKRKLRAKLHDFYFGGAVQPVTPAELEAAHHDHGHEAIESGDKVSTH